MSQIWKEPGGHHVIEIKDKSPYENDPFPDLGKLLNSTPDARKHLFKPFHEVCKEFGVGWNINTKSLIDKMRNIKGAIPENIYQEIIGEVKKLPLEIITKFSPPSARIFIDGVGEEVYYKATAIAQKDSLPINRFFSTIIINSYKMRELISMMKNIMRRSESKFILCKKCSKVSVVPVNFPSNQCQYCNSNQVETYYPLYIPIEVFSEWESGGNRFLEVMTYNAIKEISHDKVFSNVSLKKKMQRTGEIDVFISQSRNKGCAVLATTNPHLPDEKRQAERLKKIRGLDFIVVTTQSSCGVMGKHALETFSNVITDRNFPASLINFLKEKSII